MPHPRIRWPVVALSAACLFLCLFMLQCAARRMVAGSVTPQQLYARLGRELATAHMLPLGGVAALKQAVGALGLGELLPAADGTGSRMMSTPGGGVEAMTTGARVVWIQLRVEPWRGRPRTPLGQAVLEVARLRLGAQAEAARKRDGLRLVPSHFSFPVVVGGLDYVFTPGFSGEKLSSILIARSGSAAAGAGV
jgi:hypothetical protein